MRNVPPRFLVSLLLPLLSGVFLSTAPRAQQLPSPFVPANGVYWDCEVVEHLYLWKEGFRSFPTPDPKHGSHLIINMRSGEVSGPLPDLQWSRMPVVKTFSRLQCLHDERTCCRWHTRERSRSVWKFSRGYSLFR